MPTINIFWFRRDLRLNDNAGLYHALRDGIPVVPFFLFDTCILDDLENKADRRVEFIHAALNDIQRQLLKIGTTLEIIHAAPLQAFQLLIKKYKIGKVFTNHDYEPYALQRDHEIKNLLSENDIAFFSYKDQVIFEKNEVSKDDGNPYAIFTPYSRKWKTLLNEFYLTPYPSEKRTAGFYKQPPPPFPSLQDIGFKEVNLPFPGKEIDDGLIREYALHRNFPAIKGTSRIGVHLRFGTISIRQLAAHTKELSVTYLDELIWRDFYHMILWHFPQVGKGYSFRAAYDHIRWRRDDDQFLLWCNGQTGYPIVDAGMRELNATGFMHNRVRMIVASFLCKHLLLDWRLGEAYFAEKLLDYDLAANNGGWQWASGSGCDAAPYFRIFNPYLQTKKFDPTFDYIRKWVPEFQEFNYPKPVVDHAFARKRCLETYAAALRNNA
jgi:deoxyribodipyrimidine photo-lyase